MGEVGPEKYDVSARTEFGELLKKYEHTAVVKKYAGVTRKFITLFSRTVSGIKDNEKQVLSIVAAKKETEGETNDWQLTIDVRSHFVMDDGVVRPTKTGINIRQELASTLLRNAQDIQTMIKIFNEKMPEERSNKRKTPYEKKPVAKVAKTDDDDFGALFNEWTNLMEKFRVKLQRN